MHLSLLSASCERVSSPSKPHTTAGYHRNRPLAVRGLRVSSFEEMPNPLPYMGTMRLKILALGETQVGKSSVINRYRWDYHSVIPSINCQHSDDQFTTEYNPTMGIDFREALKPRERVHDGQNVRVVTSFFDMSGDIQFLKVRSEFYQDFHGVLLVFDVTSRQSFERLEMWLGEAMKFGNGKPVSNCVVCGNKTDMGSQRAVQTREAKNWCSSKGFNYFETSCRTGQNVTKAIDALIDACDGDCKRAPAFPHSAPRQPAPETQAPPPQATSTMDPDKMSVKEIKRELERLNVAYADCLEKKDFVKRFQEAKTKREQFREQQTRDQAAAREKYCFDPHTCAATARSLRALVEFHEISSKLLSGTYTLMLLVRSILLENRGKLLRKRRGKIQKM